jgi:hypothetical protein
MERTRRAASARSDGFPPQGWSIENGVLKTHENGGHESKAGGDIITEKRFANFELTVDFKLTPGANSGIKLFVQPGLAPISAGGTATVGSAIGIEFQILDDARHPTRARPRRQPHGGLPHDLIPAPGDKKVSPMGEWNPRGCCRRATTSSPAECVKTVELERGSARFRELVASTGTFRLWRVEGRHILLRSTATRCGSATSRSASSAPGSPGHLGSAPLRSSPRRLPGPREVRGVPVVLSHREPPSARPDPEACRVTERSQ